MNDLEEKREVGTVVMRKSLEAYDVEEQGEMC